MKKVVKKPSAKMQVGGKVKAKSVEKNPMLDMQLKAKAKKAKSGGSFPDLNKDGKVTKADVLVGRGVIKAKKGSSVKKAQLGGLFGKLAGGKGLLSKGMKAGAKSGMMGGLMGMFGRRKKQASAAPEAQATMKKGGKMKKCKYGCK